MPIDLQALINAVGYPGLFLIVFAETGLLIGFFLPGDTLLVTAGLLVQRGHLSVAGENGLWLLIPLLIVAAVLGDAVGYQVGKHTGPRLFNREDSRLFHRKHLERARDFYDRHGGKTIVIARFLAFIRTFAPTVAGAAAMPYRKFAVYNILGGVSWVVSMVLVGYYVGKAVPNIEVFFTGLVVLMVTISVAPAALHLLRERVRARRQAKANAS
ncbi:MAG: VTT domain-containing protein [Chloroflexi bacterium]|nr:VTT domain-containing protein [Chloroflexota bacterium]